MTSQNKHCTRFPPISLSLSLTLSLWLKFCLKTAFWIFQTLSLWPFLFSQTPFQIQNPKIWFLSIFYKSVSYSVREKFPFFSLLGIKFFSLNLLQKLRIFHHLGVEFQKGMFFFFGWFFEFLLEDWRRWFGEEDDQRKTVSDFQFGCAETGCFGFDFAVIFFRAWLGFLGKQVFVKPFCSNSAFQVQIFIYWV